MRLCIIGIIWPQFRPHTGCSLTLLLGLSAALCLNAQSNLRPGSRTTLDAHNCYPYEGQWRDRIDRALSHGTPVAIEQDLFWYTDPSTGEHRSVLAHTAELHGDEPGMERYFFDSVRPIMEAALKDPKPETWPLITLNLDIKTEEPEHLRAIWKLLDSHRAWLTTAINTADPRLVQPLHAGPLLVLGGVSDAQERIFRSEVPVGSPLLIFGAVHVASVDASTEVAALETESATNYRRWWNNSWATVEQGGPSAAGEWSEALQQRVRAMIRQVHTRGLWIRFYTLDGASPLEQRRNGWFRTYNFPSEAAAQLRWRTLIAEGADYIATDEYGKVFAAITATSKRDK
jgi:hypothetical protein